MVCKYSKVNNCFNCFGKHQPYAGRNSTINNKTSQTKQCNLNFTYDIEFVGGPFGKLRRTRRDTRTAGCEPLPRKYDSMLDDKEKRNKENNLPFPYVYELNSL